MKEDYGLLDVLFDPEIYPKKKKGTGLLFSFLFAWMAYSIDNNHMLAIAIASMVIGWIAILVIKITLYNKGKGYKDYLMVALLISLIYGMIFVIE